MRQGRLHPAAGAVLVFALVFAAGLTLARLVRLQADRDERERVEAAAVVAARSVENEVARSLSATYAIAALLRQHGHIDDFDRLAAEMLPLYGGLSTLQLAPGGVIRQIHPLAGTRRPSATTSSRIPTDASRRRRPSARGDSPSRGRSS